VVKCLEIFRVTYKPAKLWDVKVEVLEEYDAEVVEKRGIDSSQKVLQILINAFEYKFGESGEDKACGRRQVLACCVGERPRGTKLEVKGFESGHHCQGSGHRIG